MLKKSFVVMVGASNLTISLPVAIKLIMDFIEGPKSIFVAHGPGRSYLKRAGLPMFRFQGISICPLFDNLETATNNIAQAKIYALVTDIGDDLLYNQKPKNIAKGVEKVLNRLNNLGAEIAVTPPPMVSINNLSQKRYYFLRSFYYPFCHISYSEIMVNVSLLTNLINELCFKYKVKLLNQNPNWYGFDRIHLFGRFQKIAYCSWFSTLFKQNHREKTKFKISMRQLLLRHLHCYKSLFSDKYYLQTGWQIAPETDLYLY
jgi:hypothetical protein